MLRKFVRPALVVCLFAGVGAAKADEEAVRSGVEAFVGAPVVDSVTATRYGGLYEVVLRSGELVYTDARVSFLIDGRVIDTQTRRDVTQARLTELSAIDFDTLPLDDAIKQVKGDGSRIIASFEDPNCGYCKRLGQDLAQMDNVTIYTFLYPILGDRSVEMSKNIWCAEDRADSWNGWILDNKMPSQASCDTAAVDSNLALGQQLRINGTPTMFLADGRRLGGYVPAEQLEQALASVTE